MTKIGSKNNLYPHMYFTKYLMGTFRKPPWESDLNCEFSSLLIRRLKNYTKNQLQASQHTKIRRQNLIKQSSGCSEVTEDDHVAAGSSFGTETKNPSRSGRQFSLTKKKRKGSKFTAWNRETEQNGNHTPTELRRVSHEWQTNERTFPRGLKAT
jgi:hypothetical protein